MTMHLKKCHKCGEIYDVEKCPFCREKMIKEIEKMKGRKNGKRIE